MHPLRIHGNIDYDVLKRVWESIFWLGGFEDGGVEDLRLRGINGPRSGGRRFSGRGLV